MTKNRYGPLEERILLMMDDHNGLSVLDVLSHFMDITLLDAIKLLDKLAKKKYVKHTPRQSLFTDFTTDMANMFRYEDPTLYIEYFYYYEITDYGRSKANLIRTTTRHHPDVQQKPYVSYATKCYKRYQFISMNTRLFNDKKWYECINFGKNGTPHAY